MARFEQHLAVSLALGIGCGAFAAEQLSLPWQEAAAATVLCAVGGVVPDIDHPHSRFAEFVFSTGALLVVLMVSRIVGLTLSGIGSVGLTIALFWLARWGIRTLLAMTTVHRGMVHSIPACLIWGGLIFAGFPESSVSTRAVLAASAALGFASHLLLDELFAFVDASGVRFTPKRSLGSALKLWSSAAPRASLVAYGLLALVAWLCWRSL
jgi:membrane-bound metal-dependent hydrolase YbcI (DUF457 family)